MQAMTTTVQDIRDAQYDLIVEIASFSRLLNLTPQATPHTIAHQAQKIEDSANVLKHATKRFEEGI